jgi:hypothetical protein
MWSHRGLRYVAIYLALVGVATIPVALHLGKFVGIYLGALTLPWSLIGVLISDAISPSLLDRAIVGLSICAIGAAINSVLLYRWSTRANKRDTVPKPHVGDEWKQ